MGFFNEGNVADVNEVEDIKKLGVINMAIEKCLECGGILKEILTQYQGNYVVKDMQVTVIEVPALVCVDCGDKYFDSETAYAIHRLVDEIIAEYLVLPSTVTVRFKEL